MLKDKILEKIHMFLWNSIIMPVRPKGQIKMLGEYWVIHKGK